MLHVLIVEDDAFLLRVYRQELEAAGVAVHAAPNGEQALTMLADPNLQLDVIVLDIMLPGKDGFDVLRELKDIPGRAPIPVIILSNLRQQVDLERAQAMGAKEYINKGEIKAGDLASVVEKYGRR